MFSAIADIASSAIGTAGDIGTAEAASEAIPPSSDTLSTGGKAFGDNNFSFNPGSSNDDDLMQQLTVAIIVSVIAGGIVAWASK